MNIKNMKHDELITKLKELRLTGMAAQYVEAAKIAEKEKLTYEQYLAKLVEVETEIKRYAKIKRLLHEAKLPLRKTMESYDFSLRTGITAKQFNRLAEGNFVREAANVVFYGSFGVGKTHLSMSLTTLLCEKGFKCYFTSTHALIAELLKAKNDLTLVSFLKRLDRFDLIVCDELGYIPQEQAGADLFFQLISQRDERKSLLITTNLTYSEWDKVFLNPFSTQAAVDRIIRNCETFNIDGESFRKITAKKRQQTQQTTLTSEIN